jgi:peptidoglycan/xylan/chitin deacetylase (PgdA/CDA1 family)
MSRLWLLFLAIMTTSWLWIRTPVWSAPLYTNPDAGSPDAALPDAGQKLAPTPSVPPTLPNYEAHIDGKPHQIFVTIDDHPSRQTDAYLDLLKASGIKATIFIVSYPLYGYIRTPQYSYVAKMAESLRRALREGHLIGNHSVSHRLMCKMDRHTAEWEVGRTQVWAKQVLGIDIKLWRPPHGHICPVVQKIVASYQLVTIMWDVDDWRSTPDSMVRIIKTRARRGSGSTMVLFHNDIIKFKKFLQLLPPARN